MKSDSTTKERENHNKERKKRQENVRIFRRKKADRRREQRKRTWCNVFRNNNVEKEERENRKRKNQSDEKKRWGKYQHPKDSLPKNISSPCPNSPWQSIILRFNYKKWILLLRENRWRGSVYTERDSRREHNHNDISLSSLSLLFFFDDVLHEKRKRRGCNPIFSRTWLVCPHKKDSHESSVFQNG